jgi:polysaccharide pyruvyl transferase WcaK-like protein
MIYVALLALVHSMTAEVQYARPACLFITKIRFDANRQASSFQQSVNKQVATSRSQQAAAC